MPFGHLGEGAFGNVGTKKILSTASPEDLFLMLGVWRTAHLGAVTRPGARLGGRLALEGRLGLGGSSPPRSAMLGTTAEQMRI